MSYPTQFLETCPPLLKNRTILEKKFECKIGESFPKKDFEYKWAFMRPRVKEHNKSIKQAGNDVLLAK